MSTNRPGTDRSRHLSDEEDVSRRRDGSLEDPRARAHDRGRSVDPRPRPARVGCGATANDGVRGRCVPHPGGKAAALLHSLACNYALADGNKRLALAATIAILGVNGRRLTLSNSKAYDLIIAVASGELDDVTVIADRLGRGTEAR